MNQRQLELRQLVRALRAECSRMHSEHWYAFDDDAPYGLLPVQRVSLEEARMALRIADDGDYGVCIDCDASITLERLQARPTSVRCLDCQRRLEASTAA